LAISELKLERENQVTVLFVFDESRGAESRVVVDVILFDKPERTVEVRKKVLKSVYDEIKKYMEKIFVEVFIWPIPAENCYSGE